MTLEQFHKISETYAGMLQHLAIMQERLRRRVLGISAWEKLSQVRVDLSEGKQYMRMDKVLVVGPDPEPVEEAQPVQIM